MRASYPLLSFVLLLCTACGQGVQPPKAAWQSIPGRDIAVSESIYRARVPASWQRQPPLADAQREDTMLPICRYHIDDEEGQIAITVHNFPTDSARDRVPCVSQVERWQRQTGSRAQSSDLVQPVAHGGFVGLSYCADGVRAWSFDMADEHYHTLSQSPESKLKRQMRADCTIKATGPESALQRHDREITAFAHSFELINEIPSRGIDR